MSKQSSCHPEREHRSLGLCKPCYHAQRYKNDRRYYLRSTESRFKRLYGITWADYEKMFASQHGVCAICKSPPKKRRLSVDHCHQTGRIRGLLCDPCNHILLGAAKDSLSKLQAAIEYLKGGLI